MQELHKRGIGTGVHFIPVHRHKHYAENFGFQPGDFPNAEYIGDRTISLPLSSKLTDAEVERIVRTVRDIILKR
jgi:dTDP-4-amino-4,6-dideoxygalactose transaminase